MLSALHGRRLSLPARRRYGLDPVQPSPVSQPPRSRRRRVSGLTVRYRLAGLAPRRRPFVSYSPRRLQQESTSPPLTRGRTAV